MADEIAIIEKNTREDVRVSLSEFHGVNVVDVRIYVDLSTGPAGAIRSPTKKGVSLRVDRLDDLIDGLARARSEAQRLGLATCVRANGGGDE